jgi:NADPH:quinone reductase-like Zn-dependent oxidoreductase
MPWPAVRGIRPDTEANPTMFDGRRPQTVSQKPFSQQYRQWSSIMATIRAYRIHRFGDLQLDLLDIGPHTNNVLVETHAVGINPVDHKMLDGAYPMVTARDLPYTLGRDIAGVISRVPPGHQQWRVGDAVYGFVGQQQGTFADFVAVPPDLLARKPERLDLRAAAAVPLAALTAWQGLFDHGKLAAGQRVLIHAGAGGVGHFAIQFAYRAGAYVFATASGEGIDFARALGADRIIDHQSQRFEEHCSPVDLVLDLVGGETQLRSWTLVKPGGRLVSTLGQPDASEAAHRKAHGLRFTCEPNAQQLTRIGELIDAGHVRVEVTGTYSFAHLPDALARLRRGHVRGKIVVHVQ